MTEVKKKTSETNQQQLKMTKNNEEKRTGCTVKILRFISYGVAEWEKEKKGFFAESKKRREQPPAVITTVLHEIVPIRRRIALKFDIIGRLQNLAAGPIRLLLPMTI